MGTVVASTNHALGHLPFTLDLSCPISLPTKPLAGVAWPLPVAGPSTIPDETCFTADLLRFATQSSSVPPSASDNPIEIKPFLLSLPQIETRHRKVLLPLLSGSGKQSDDLPIVEPELGVVRVALDLRISSRAALDHGMIQTPKQLSDEMEKRETLLQLILLLRYLSLPSVSTHTDQKRKRSRHSRRNDDDAPVVVSPVDDPKTALELLMDRLSVWQAVSELGLGLDAGLGVIGLDQARKGKGKAGEEENAVAAMLKMFWDEVLIPFFLQSHFEACSAFHLKVFGRPIPTKLLPNMPSTTKKPRKPKLTRARPSTDDLIPAPSWRRDRESDKGSRRGLTSRPASRAPSDAGSKASPPLRESIGMKRTISRTSETQSQSQSQSQFRRSRSASIDPMARTDSTSSTFGTHVHKKPLMRAPSGKDLFKGREVGLMRRTASKKADGLGREDSQGSGRFGLLGRKTSGGKESQSQSQSQRGNSTEEPQKPGTNSNTLILATPSKPRHNMFAPRQTQWYHPTPIQEETPGSSSTPRPKPTFVAETPVAPGRVATDCRYSGLGSMDYEDLGEESDDPLADLMVMTDDEDEPSSGGRAMVPETPIK
ncbi:hypothetical protein IAR55_004324 [Kwoniella newhampshirensis]|uniref:DNA replication regulator Sld3 C-terminal domain-containing protein n=1 Tax=Kwoniella newhampshirensis TaxID=1651941 RepID=A0AAW0YP95_9TREE